MYHFNIKFIQILLLSSLPSLHLSLIKNDTNILNAAAVWCQTFFQSCGNINLNVCHYCYKCSMLKHDIAACKTFRWIYKYCITFLPQSL